MSFLAALKKAKYEFQVNEETEAENRKRGREEENVARDRMLLAIEVALSEIHGMFGWWITFAEAARKQAGDVALITRRADNFAALVYFHFEQVPGTFARHISIRLSSTDKGTTYIQSAEVGGFLHHLADWLAKNEKAL